MYVPSKEANTLKSKEKLNLPSNPENWQKADTILATAVVPAAPTVDLKNQYLCELTYFTMAEHFGTKPVKYNHPKSSKYHPHNREIK